MASQPITFLEIDGKVLSGEEFEEYCKDHGLCRRCARVKTHRRIVKMFGRGRKWEPMTLHDDMTGEYTVYKGYCLQATCYTLGQAKRMLGEGGGGRRSGGGASRRQRLAARLKGKNSAKRPSRRKPRANPETGSVMSGMGADDDDDDVSVGSNVSGISQMSGLSAMSGLSGMSGMSGFSLGGFRRRRKSKRSSSGTASSASSVSSMESMEDDDITVDSTMTNDVNPMVDEGEVNPIVSHRVEQLTLYDYFTVLDLSKVVLRTEDLEAVVGALGKAKTLESITMDKCKLRDEGVEKIMEGIKAGNHVNLKKLSLRQNNMGNKGAESLTFLLENSSTLEELDVSENAISSRGAAAILGALKKNRKCALNTLNLSQNEIWDLDDGSFLGTNRTLKVLNMDGNFMHDEGAEHISNAIAGNKHSIIEKLYLGWNGIADDGATALAKMMEANSTLQVLGLAENDISNAGARALLSALAINTSVREISGLYHNQIDRKFIIVAIKRLLHRYGERGGAPQIRLEGEDEEEQRMSGMPQEAKMPEGESDSGSDGSTNWAAAMYSEPEPAEVSPTRRSSAALEAIENWDWGTFGIEDEIDNLEKPAVALPAPMADVESEDELEESKPPTGPTGTTIKASRISVFRSAPLAYFNRQTSEHHDVPLLDFDQEKAALDDLVKDKDLGASIEIIHEIATQDRLKEFFSRGTSPVLHFSSHGNAECLALENGFGYMHALDPSELQQYVMLNQGTTKVVVVSSVHARSTAKIFLDAGVKHVVCCEREATFRDEAPVEFTKVFYRSLAKNKTLQDAFEDGLEAVKRHPSTTTLKKSTDRFQLLPKQPANSSYHKINVLFQGSLPKKPVLPPPGDTSMLPPLPNQFVGREVDMYEVLESLRVDDVIRVGGADGSGKATLLSAVSHYILARPTSFGIGEIYWLPAPPDIYPEEDTCYGDLCQVMDLLVEAEDDIWDEELYAECRERIMIELEDQKTILIIDGRIFDTEAAGENLERFLSHLLNEVSVKIILLTAQEGSSRAKRSRSEETMITVGPLDFKASSLLFGDSCPHVSPDGNAMVHTPDAFANFMVPPSVKKQGADLNKALSRRQQELYDRMGKGNPRDIIATAAAISAADLVSMLRFAQRPEVQVESAEVLKHELAKRTSQLEKAIKGKNFLRARDLAETVEELEFLKSRYPSMDDLLSKEKDLKKEFSELLKARKYDDANKVKRKILALKKDIMKEKFAKPKGAGTVVASARLQQLQAKMDEMMAQANKVSLSDEDKADETFAIPQENNNVCRLHISKGEIISYKYSGGLSGIICWTNESCAFSGYATGEKILKAGGDNLEEDIELIEPVAETKWGPARIATGEAEIVGPRSYHNLAARYVVMAVPILSPANDDEEWDGENTDEDALHVLDTGLRTCYRSSFRLVKNTGMEGVGVPTVTTKEGGKVYERTLRIGLQTVIEEAKTTRLKSIDYIASSEKEAKILIKMAHTIGLVVAKAEEEP